MKGKSLKALIVSLIAALLIFIPVLGTAQTTEAAVKEKFDGGYDAAMSFSGTAATKDGESTFPKVKITPKYRQTEARKMLSQLNNWRAGTNWYYNKKNTKVKVSEGYRKI